MPIEKFKYEKRYYYPNLRDKETLLWERFLAKFPDAYDDVAYNVKVGLGQPVPEGTSEEMAKDWNELTQQKIDVVGFKGERIDLIEIKPGINMGGPGQLWKYEKLYRKTYGHTARLGLLLLTDNTSRDLEAFLEGEEIELIIV